jgi:hypothetical protein
MTRTVEVQAAAPGLLGFDSNTKITATTAQSFFEGGFRFCVRYVSRGPESSGDLSPQEVNDILDSGLALMPVQHVRVEGWVPTAALGEQDGTDAAANAADVGFESGVNVWCDLEGIRSTVQAEVVIAYCNAWYEAVSATGFTPGLYVGAKSILTDEQLYANLRFRHYWRSHSIVPNIQRRGYQLLQLWPITTLYGIEVDFDVTQDDYIGDQVQWQRLAP